MGNGSGLGSELSPIGKTRHYHKTILIISLCLFTKIEKPIAWFEHSMDQIEQEIRKLKRGGNTGDSISQDGGWQLECIRFTNGFHRFPISELYGFTRYCILCVGKQSLHLRYLLIHACVSDLPNMEAKPLFIIWFLHLFTFVTSSASQKNAWRHPASPGY